MNRAVPLSFVAGAIACVLAAGAAQAAPASGGVLGKLSANAQTATQIEQVGWKKNHRRHWRKKCIRRCMWRSGRSFYRCRRVCSHRRW